MARARELYATAAGLWAGQGLPRWAAWSNVGLIATLHALGEETEAAEVRRRARETFLLIRDGRGVAVLDGGEAARTGAR
jgi:hypothetical protein